MPTIKVFLSSPSDVAGERARAEQIISELNAEFAGETVLELYRWEESFFTAAESFQSQIIDPSNVEIVVCIFWKRLGSTLPDNFNRPDGTSRTGTEYEFELALDAARERDPRFPDIFVYRKTEKIFFSEEHFEQERQEKKLLDEFWTKWFRNEQGHFTSSFKNFQTIDEFAETLEADLRAWLRKRSGDVDWDTSTKGSPYRGLEAFNEEHSAIFFGRRREVDRARAKLIETATKGFPLLFIVGASGSGKSSLMKAGLVSRLMAPDSTPQIERFMRVITTPAQLGPDALDRLARHIISAAGRAGAAPGNALNSANLGAALRDRPDEAASTIVQMLDAWSRTLQQQDGRQTAPRTGMLLCVDQFEEVFARSEQSRADFARALRTLARTGRIWVVATMRSDFFEPLLLDESLRTLRESGATLEIAPPSSSDIRDIVVRPATAARVSLETSADGKRDLAALIEGEAAQPGALPMIQFLLDRLFDLRTGSVMTLAAYDNLGGAAGALAAHGDEIIAGCSQPAQEQFAKLVRALVKVEATSSKPTARSTALSDFPANTPIRELVDALALGRLLTIAADSDASDGQANATVRLAHEALLERWDRLRLEVSRNLRDLQTRERLDQSFALWSEAEGRNKKRRLLRDLELEEGLDLAQRWDDELPAPMREFIAVSERESAATRRSENMRWTIGAGLGIAAVALAAVAWLTFTNGREIAEQRDQARYLHSEILADRARQFLANGDVDAAGLLAAEALADAEACGLNEPAPRCAKALAVLRTALSRLRPDQAPVELQNVYESAASVLDIAVDQSGRRMAIVSWNNEVLVREIESGNLVRTLRVAGCGPLGDEINAMQCIPGRAVFMRDGQRLLVSYRDGVLRMWNLADGALLNEWAAVDAAQSIRLRLSPDESKVVVVSYNNVASMYELSASAEGRLIEGYVEDACYLPDGRLVWYSNYTLSVGNPLSPETAQQIYAEGGRIECHTNQQVVTVGYSAVSVINPSLLEAQAQIIPRAGGTAAWLTALSRDGRWLAIGGYDAADDTVEVVDLRSGQSRGMFKTYGGLAQGLAFTGGGDLLVGGINWRLARWSLAELAPAVESQQTRTLQPINTSESYGYAADRSLAIFPTYTYDQNTGASTVGSVRSVPLSDDRPEMTRELGDALCPNEQERVATPDLCVPMGVFSDDDNDTILVTGSQKLAELDASTLVTVNTAVEVPAGSYYLARGGKTVLMQEGGNVVHPIGLGQRRINADPIIHSSPIMTADVSFNGDYAVTGDDGGRVRLWSAASGQRGAWRAHEGAISNVAVSNDGRYIATVDAEGLVRLWSNEHEMLGEYSLGETPFNFNFTANGQYLIALSYSYSGQYNYGYNYNYSSAGEGYRWRIGEEGAAGSRLIFDSRASRVGYMNSASGTPFEVSQSQTTMTSVNWEPVRQLAPQIEIALVQVLANRPMNRTERLIVSSEPTMALREWPDDRDPCEDLAAHPGDPDRRAPAITYTAINLDAAERACSAAIARDPNEGRFHSLLARVESSRAGVARDQHDTDTYREHLVLARTSAREAERLGYRFAAQQLGYFALSPDVPDLYEREEGVRLLEKAWRDGVDRASVDLSTYYETGNISDSDNIWEGFEPDPEAARLWMDRGALALEPWALRFVSNCWQMSSEPGRSDADGTRKCRSFFESRLNSTARLALALYHYDLAMIQWQFLDFPQDEQWLRDYAGVRNIALQLPEVVAACVHLRAWQVANRHHDRRVEELSSTRRICRETFEEQGISLQIGSPEVARARRDMGR